MNKWFVPLVLLVAPALLMAGGAPPNSDSLPTEVAKGRQIYEQYCAACHGPGGDGNPALGAPRLNDAIWLYGGELPAIVTSVGQGRNGRMPAFEGRLDDLQIRLLVAWLTGGAAAGAAPAP